MNQPPHHPGMRPMPPQHPGHPGQSAPHPQQHQGYGGAPQGYGAPYPQQQGYAQHPPQPSYAQPYGGAGSSLPKPTNETLTFVMGLLGVVTFIPIFGIIAWVASGKGRKEVARRQAAPSGLLTAGWVMGIISTIIGTLYVVAMVLFFMLIFAFETHAY